MGGGFNGLRNWFGGSILNNGGLKLLKGRNLGEILNYQFGIGPLIVLEPFWGAFITEISLKGKGSFGPTVEETSRD